jgi:TP901 family phage tail tape measure protein
MSLKIDRLQLEIVINNDQARKSLRLLEDEARQLKKDLKKVPEGSDEWNKISNRLKAIQLQHDGIIDKMGIEKLSLKELAQRQRELNAIMRNLDPTVKEFKVLEDQLIKIKERQKQLREDSSLSETERQKEKAQIENNIIAHKKLLDTIGVENLTITQLTQAQKDLSVILSTVNPNTEEYKAYEKELISVKYRLNQLKEQGSITNIEAERSEQQIRQNIIEYKKLADTIGIQKMSLNQLTAYQKDLNHVMGNMSPAINEYKKLELELQKVTKRKAQLRETTNSTSASMSKLTAGFNQLGAALGITGGLYMAVSAVKSYIKTVVAFEDEIANVRKTTGLTRKEVKGLQQDFQSLETRTPRAELMALAVEAGRLGKKSRQDVLDFVEVANQIKIALGDDLGGNAEEAIREVGKLTNIYKIGEQYGTDFKESMLKMGSAINEVSASSQAQAPFLIETLKRLGGIADQANITSGSVIGYGSALDQLGQRTEMSTTALSKVILNMFTDTATYADIAQMSLEEFTKLLNTDANEAFLKVLEGLNGNNDGLSIMGEKLQGLGLDGSRAVQVLASLASHTEMIRKEQTLANSALEAGVSLTDEYQIRNNNLAGAISKSGEAWDSYTLSLNNSNGVLKDFFDNLTNTINSLSILENIPVKGSVIGGGLARFFGYGKKDIEKSSEDIKSYYDSLRKMNIDELTKTYTIQAGLVEKFRIEGDEAEARAQQRRLSYIGKLISEKNTVDGSSGETPEQKAARLAQEAAVKQVEIAQKTKELFMSDLDIKLKALDGEAAKLREQGIAEVDIARWVAQEKQKIYDSQPKAKKAEESAYTKQLAEAKFWADEEAKLMANNAAEANKFREDDLKAIEDKYKREKTLAETKYNEELLALGTDEKAKADFKKQFDAQELQRSLDHLNALKAQLEQTLANVNIADSMLSGEDMIALQDKITELKLAISELKLLANPDDAKPKKGLVGELLFGFEDEDNLMAKIVKVAQFASTVFSQINKIISNSEQRQLQEFQRSNDAKKQALDERLKSGKISQDNYNAAIANLDADLDKKKRKIDHDQAVRTKALGLFGAIINTAGGIARALVDPGGVAGIILAVVAGVMGALQIAAIASEPVPALAQGNRQKILADDGKTYNAKVASSDHASGLFNEPTYVPGFGLFGETRDPELVFNPRDTQAIINSPALIDAINMTLGGARQYAQGNSREIIRENNTVTTTAMDPETMALLSDIRKRLDEPATAYLVADEDYIRTHKKKVTEYDTFKKLIGN